MPKVFLDVGANDGKSSLNLAGNPDWVVYAFEPIPELAAGLREAAGAATNYHVIEKGVSDTAGTATFNVTRNGDWGTSSLLDFREDLEAAWGPRGDLKTTDTLTIEVITLADFVAEHGIDRIEYLHTDVQGLDMEVILGLGDLISIVHGGDIECSRNHDVKLYKQEAFVLEDVVLRLYQAGFVIDRIAPNDDGGSGVTEATKLWTANELNVVYRRP